MIEEQQSVEIEPENIILAPSEPNKMFTIQNTTLHYVAFRVISPNPIIFQISPSEGILDPCSSVEVEVQAKITASINYTAFQNVTKLAIISYDLEDEQSDWPNASYDQIQTCYLTIDYVAGNYKVIPQQTTAIVAQKYKLEHFNEQEKKSVINYCQEHYGRTDNYTITGTLILFNYAQPLKQFNGEHFVLLTYTPANIIHINPKYQSEPMSPQQQKKIVVVQPIPPPIVEPEPLQKSNSKELKKDKKQKSKQQPPTTTTTVQEVEQQQQQQQEVPSPRKLRHYQSEIIHKSEFNQEPIQQAPQGKILQQGQTPIRIEENKSKQVEQSSFSQSVPIQPNFRRIAIFNNYSAIKLVLLMKDNSYLITVNEKDIIKVWSLQMNSEVGMIHVHTEIKKCTIIAVHEWIDPTSQDFITVGSDHKIRVFSIQSMKLEKQLDIPEFSEITALIFLPDKEQLCLGGLPKPEFSLFGQKYPKYRYLKIFDVYSLNEVLSYKIPTTDNNSILYPIVYTDNELVKHARLNNILVVCKTNKTTGGGEVLLLMIDMDDNCSVIMTLSFDSLAMYSVRNVFYLPQRGSFVFVEKSDPKSYQQNKIVLVNVKQLQTNNGLQNGIVCKYFDEPSIIEDDVFVLQKMELIIKVSGDIVHVIDLKSNTQHNVQVSTQIGGNPKNIIMAGKIVRIDGEVIQILELLS